jgi:hypothetical protein
MVTENNRFYFLLTGLLVVLLVAPITTEDFPGFTGMLLTVTLLIAVMSMSTSKRFRAVAWSLVAAKIILAGLILIYPSTAAHLVEGLIVLVFFVVATVFSFQRVLDGEFVDMNRIAGAISIYMLIGLIWASMYFFLHIVNPEAFEGLKETGPSQIAQMNNAYMDLLYFSYVTLSTLGYGDVTPVSRAAQSFAYLESICGVMYIAVLVSALVGSYGNKRVAQA